MFTHKLWEASQNRSGSSLANTAAEHRERLRALADHVQFLSQAGIHGTAGARTAPKTGSTSVPNVYDVWGKVHPDISQLLAKLLSMEDDQGGFSVSNSGSRDIASTDSQHYLPVQPPSLDVPHWDVLEESRPFNAWGFQTAPMTTPLPDISHMPINLPAQAFNFISCYPSDSPLAGQEMSSVNAGDIWYANHPETINQQLDGYNMSEDTSNILACNEALAHWIPSSNQTTQLAIPIDPDLSQSQIRTVTHAYNDLPGTSHYHNMDFSIGTFTSSEPSSNQYQYHDNTAPVHDWGH